MAFVETQQSDEIYMMLAYKWSGFATHFVVDGSVFIEGLLLSVLTSILTSIVLLGDNR